MITAEIIPYVTSLAAGKGSMNEGTDCIDWEN